MSPSLRTVTRQQRIDEVRSAQRNIYVATETLL